MHKILPIAVNCNEIFTATHLNVGKFYSTFLQANIEGQMRGDMNDCFYFPPKFPKYFFFSKLSMAVCIRLSRFSTSLFFQNAGS